MLAPIFPTPPPARDGRILTAPRAATDPPMEVQVAETGPCSRTLTITVPAERVKQHVDELYRSAQRQVQMKGFRPGKVPRHMIEKHHGSAILADAKEQLLNNCFGEACRAKELSPVGRIVIDDFEKLELKPDAGLQFVARIDVRPKFDLQPVTGIEVDGYDGEATDQDVDNALKEIANQKRSIKPTDSPVEDGDFVKADLTFHDEAGNVVHERKGAQLNTRIPIAGVESDAFSKALLGVAAGATVELPLQFPDSFEKEAFRGKPGKAVLHVHQVLRVQPAPIDDTLAKGLEFADLAALKADLRQRIASEKVRVGKLRQEEQCLQRLLELHPFELPNSLVEEQQQASLAAFAERLKRDGATEEQAQQKVEESKAEAHQDAVRRVRLFFLIEAVARQQKLFVTESDVETEILNIARANDATPAQVREHLEQQKQLGELRLALLERKVRDFLRDHAKIVDRKVG